MAYNEIRTINNIQLEDIKARQSIQELDNKKANKSDIVSGLNFKGTTTYSALPTSDNNIGDFYYVTDGDGTNGEGNYAWNGTAWYFSGKTTDFGDISTKANTAVNNADFEEGKLKVTKNDGTSTETEVIDSSLTKSGKAADAKITGDEIGQLKEDFSQLNIIGGVVEPTLNWTQGKYVNNSTNAITNGSNQLYITDYLTIPNKCYEILITKIDNLSVAWTVAFYDVSKTFVSGLSSSTFGTFIITESDIPENAKYIIATHYDDGTHSVDNITVEFHTFKRFADIESELTVLNDEMPVRDESYSNILDVASTFTDNKFINDKGNVVTNANFCLIDGYYPVKPNTIYKLYRGEPSLYSNAGHNWTWWDENKNFISYVLSGSAVTSPANAAFLRFGVYISNTGSVTHATFDATKVIITEDGKPYFDTDFSDSFVTRPTLKGLKWIGIGDSITEDNFRATYHYHDYIKAETGLTFVNMGVSGTGYKAEGSGDKAFYKRVPNMATDADIITIFGGVNDVVLSNADIGTETDTGTATICGCVNNTLDVIETLYPAHMPIGIISPLPCACVDTVVNLHPLQNPADDTCRMAVFVEQLRLICKHRGIPFLDLFHQSNLRPWKEECREKYFSCDSAKSGDGLHPNGYGHRLIYRQIMDFVKKLAMN